MGLFFIAAYWIFFIEILQATLATLLTGVLVFDDNESLDFGDSQAKEALFRHYKDKITAKIDAVAASFANSTDQQNARKIGNVIGSICTNLILAKGTAIVTEEVIGTIAKVTENLTNIVKGETEFASTLVDLEPSVKKTLTPFTTSLEEAQNAITPGKTVWDSIKTTDVMYKNTKIPRSFEIGVGDQKFWVHPNATEHMWEYIARAKTISHNTPINSQIILTDFKATLESAIIKGLKYDDILNIGRWQFKIGRARAEGLLPVVYHAKFVPKGCV